MRRAFFMSDSIFEISRKKRPAQIVTMQRNEHEPCNLSNKHTSFNYDDLCAKFEGCAVLDPCKMQSQALCRCVDILNVTHDATLTEKYFLRNFAKFAEKC